jgi:hypothetical protein
MGGPETLSEPPALAAPRGPRGAARERDWFTGSEPGAIRAAARPAITAGAGPPRPPEAPAQERRHPKVTPPAARRDAGLPAAELLDEQHEEGQRAMPARDRLPEEVEVVDVVLGDEAEVPLGAALPALGVDQVLDDGAGLEPQPVPAPAEAEAELRLLPRGGRGGDALVEPPDLLQDAPPERHVTAARGLDVAGLGLGEVEEEPADAGEPALRIRRLRQREARGEHASRHAADRGVGVGVPVVGDQSGMRAHVVVQEHHDVAGRSPPTGVAGAGQVGRVEPQAAHSPGDGGQVRLRRRLVHRGLVDHDDLRVVRLVQEGAQHVAQDLLAPVRGHDDRKGRRHVAPELSRRGSPCARRGDARRVLPLMDGILRFRVGVVHGPTLEELGYVAVTCPRR